MWPDVSYISMPHVSMGCELNTLTKSIGYIAQCSITPAKPPAIRWTRKFSVGSDSYSDSSIIWVASSWKFHRPMSRPWNPSSSIDSEYFHLELGRSPGDEIHTNFTRVLARGGSRLPRETDRLVTMGGWVSLSDPPAIQPQLPVT